MLRSVLVVAMAAAAGAFSVQHASRLPISSRQHLVSRSAFARNLRAQEQRLQGECESSYTQRLQASAISRDFVKILAPVIPTGVVLGQIAFPIQEVMAANAEYGLLEGKAAALIHPLVMGFLYVFTLYTGYLGLQWRKIREVGDELKPLQEEQKALQAQVDALKAQEQSTASVDSKLREVSTKVAELTEQRKQLVSGNFRDKHWASASLLLASGVTISIEGAFDTYLRAGKLFPGPHLFAGAGITVLWAIAASLVPAMQKGDSNARSAHIAINAVILGLFTWQLPTGFKILDFIWNKTPWVPVAEALAK